MRFKNALLLTFLTLTLMTGKASSHPNHTNCIPQTLKQIFFQKNSSDLTFISSNGFVRRDFHPETDNAFTQAMLMLNGRGEMDLKQFKDAKSILSLSDGTPELESTHFQLGPVIAKEYPEKLVVSADFSTPENSLHKKYATIQLDNTKPLPFKNNQFDVILMRHGLCKCNGLSCCGGFEVESEKTKNFFSEVARVLNKKNPKSMAILEGNYNVMDEDLDIWISYLDEIKKTQPIKYDLVHSPSGIFYAIVIRADLH